MKRVLAFTVCLLLAPTLRAAGDPCPQYPSHIELASGSFSPMPGVQFKLHNFVATLTNRGSRPPLCFEKTTDLERGDIFADNASVTNIFAAKLASANTGLTDLKVQNGLDKVVLSGHVTKIIPLTFTLEGKLGTDGTNLILNITQIKADGIPARMLMNLVGEHLNKLLKLDGTSGIQVTDTTMMVSPEKVAHLRGHIESVQSTADGLVLHYAPPAGRKGRIHTK